MYENSAWKKCEAHARALRRTTNKFVSLRLVCFVLPGALVPPGQARGRPLLLGEARRNKRAVDARCHARIILRDLWPRP